MKKPFGAPEVCDIRAWLESKYRFWPFATFHRDAAIQSLSERGGHSASRADSTGFMSTRPSTTLAECVCASVFQGFVFGNTGTVEGAAEGRGRRWLAVRRA
jgi:hypothetical protein